MCWTSRDPRIDCGSTSPTRPPSGAATLDGEGEELGGDIGVGSAAPSAGPAAEVARGELRQVRRVAEHDVEQLATPIAGQRVAYRDVAP